MCSSDLHPIEIADIPNQHYFKLSFSSIFRPRALTSEDTKKLEKFFYDYKNEKAKDKDLIAEMENSKNKEHEDDIDMLKKKIEEMEGNQEF